MREILFRGKRIDSGEWIFGMPWIFKEKSCICPWKKGMCKYDTGFFPVEVIPETIGQYTGLKDKNGKRIFEGDVVRCGTGRICKVEYRTTPCFCGFDLSSISGFDYPPPPEWNLFGDLEVVGNIIDTVRDFLEVNHDER